MISRATSLAAPKLATKRSRKTSSGAVAETLVDPDKKGCSCGAFKAGAGCTPMTHIVHMDMHAQATRYIGSTSRLDVLEDPSEVAVSEGETAQPSLST